MPHSRILVAVVGLMVIAIGRLVGCAEVVRTGEPEECSSSAQCSDDGNDCTNVVCNDETGECEIHSKTDGSQCDFMAGFGVCEGGTCQAAPCDLSPCQDGNDCTVASCPAGATSCSILEEDPGVSCDAGGDAGECDGAGSCVGLCVGVDCDDGNECTEDSCDPADRSCDHTPAPDGTLCSDGACDGAGSCVVASRCIGVECDDGNECTSDVCDPADGSCHSMPVPDGTLCSVGACQNAMCGTVFPCTEQGIRDAIAQGGGPLTFACNGATTVTTTAPIDIDNDVILDGEGQLTVDGNGSHLVFRIGVNQTAELHRLTVSNGRTNNLGGCMENHGALTVSNSTVSGGTALRGGGIYNDGSLTVTASTVTGNAVTSGGIGGGICNEGNASLAAVIVSGNESGLHGGGVANYGGTMTVTGSTVSGNTATSVGGGIDNLGTLTITNSTISSNSALGLGGGGIWHEGGTFRVTSSTLAMRSGSPDAFFFRQAAATLSNNVIEGPCNLGSSLPSTFGAGNIESPGDTCRFDAASNMVNVSSSDLKLGPLADNGGPTATHALSLGSVAIDQIDEQDCVDPDGMRLATDQRGVVRPQGTRCDVGAFEFEH